MGTNMAEDVDKSLEFDGVGLSDNRNVLARIPLIVERVLTFLPMRDVQRAAQVCQLWSDMAKRVKKRRQQLDWLFWIRTDRNYSSAEMLITELEKYITSSLNEVRCEPVLALTFVSVSYTFNISQWSSFAFNDFHRKLKSRMPKNCNMAATWTSGMIGVQQNTNVEVEYKDGFSCLLLPKISGVEVHAFDMTVTDDNISNFSLVKYIPGQVLQNDIKALLVFSTDFGQEEKTGLIIRGLLNKQNHHIAVGGGFVDDICSPSSSDAALCNDKRVMGIAFCGDKVKAASVVIKRSVKTLKQLDDVMLRLKQCGLPEDQSIGFMFSCVGRGKRHWKKKRNVETGAFSKVFPKTPLFGFFGNGEIGIDSMTESKQNFKEDSNQIFHTYSSVIVLVSLT